MPDRSRPRFRNGSGKYGLNAVFFVRKNFLKKFFSERFAGPFRPKIAQGIRRNISTTFLEAESLGGGVDFSFRNWTGKLGAKLVQRFWRPNHSAGGRFFFLGLDGEIGRKISTTFLDEKALNFCRGDFLELWVRFGFYF